MKGFSLRDRLSDDASEDDQTTQMIGEALSSNDKVIEIRPVERSNGMGLKRLLVVGAGVIGLGYWLRHSQKPNQVLGTVKEKTADRTHRAAETIEVGGETASERIEESSERAGEAVQEFGKTAADRTEEAGETAADEADSEASVSSEM